MYGRVPERCAATCACVKLPGRGSCRRRVGAAAVPNARGALDDKLFPRRVGGWLLEPACLEVTTAASFATAGTLQTLETAHSWSIILYVGRLNRLRPHFVPAAGSLARSRRRL